MTPLCNRGNGTAPSAEDIGLPRARWAGSGQHRVNLEPYRSGTMLAFITLLERDLVDVGGTWAVRSTGLAAPALAHWFFRRHSAAVGEVEDRDLPR